jgi:hypothetical protein
LTLPLCQYSFSSLQPPTVAELVYFADFILSNDQDLTPETEESISQTHSARMPFYTLSDEIQGIDDFKGHCLKQSKIDFS